MFKACLVNEIEKISKNLFWCPKKIARNLYGYVYNSFFLLLNRVCGDEGSFFLSKFIVMIIMWYYYVKPVMQQIKSSLDLSHSLWESVNIFQNIFSLFCRTTLCYWKTTLWAFFLRLLVCTTLYRFVSYFLCMYCFHSACMLYCDLTVVRCCICILYWSYLLRKRCSPFRLFIWSTTLYRVPAYFRRNVLFRIVTCENCWVYIVTIKIIANHRA